MAGESERSTARQPEAQRQLIARWLTEALNLQHNTAPESTTRAVGEERERCARELARACGCSIRITARNNKRRLPTIEVGWQSDRPRRGLEDPRDEHGEPEDRTEPLEEV